MRSRAEIIRRLEEVERLVAAEARRKGSDIARKPAHLLSAAEAVQEAHDLCHTRPPGSVDHDEVQR